MKYTFMGNVGDGLSMAIGTRLDNIFHIDCGNQSHGIEAYYSLKDFYESLDKTPDVFILSHFHYDHYNGLQYFFDSTENWPFSIKGVYFSGIPNIQGKSTQTYFQCLQSMNERIHLETFGSYSGSIPNDFINLMKGIICGGFERKPLFQGDQISYGGNILDILWPPADIPNEHIMKLTYKSIETFNKACQLDKKLQEIYSEIKEKEKIEYLIKEGKEEGINEEHLKTIEKPKRIFPLTTRKVPSIVQAANEQLKKVANHLSIAFNMSDRILFLGDLGKYEINQVIKYLKSKNMVHFNIIISAHHGTHWANSLNNIRSDYCLTSNGKRLASKFKNEYTQISKLSLATYINRNFIIPQCPLHGNSCEWSRYNGVH